MLGRAVEAGATSAYLRVNYRALGSALVIPNKLSYFGLMIPAKRGTENWPKNLHAMVDFVRENIVNLPTSSNYFVVEFPGSRVGISGTSLTNHSYVLWVDDAQRPGHHPVRYRRSW